MDMSQLTQPESSVKKQFDLTGRIVVVSGGAGFLGLHFAEAVAEMGGIPVLLDIDSKSVDLAVSKLQDLGYDADGFVFDMTKPESVLQVVEQIEKKYKRIDVLINSAAFAMKNLQQGGEKFFAPFEEYEKDLWEVSLDVNLTGTFLLTQAIGKLMRQLNNGAIINIASDVAIISPDHRIYKPDKRFDYKGVDFNNPIGYSVTKAGILAFTRFLATYWAEFGIRVNSFSPAGVYRNHDPKFVEQLAFRIPLGRMAFPQEYKGPIVFLASDASSYMTGANLVVDGGRTAW
jgi:NAD(P)-dependent dehydrogenase (short-subunit alcohol dehydrogenase family)